VRVAGGRLRRLLLALRRSISALFSIRTQRSHVVATYHQGALGPDSRLHAGDQARKSNSRVAVAVLFLLPCHRGFSLDFDLAADGILGLGETPSRKPGITLSTHAPA